MCRFAAYLGPPAPLSTLLYDPPRSLELQSYKPAQQRYGAVNVDGTGMAWWAPDAPEPLRYRVDRPPWQDANLPSLSRRLHSRAQLVMVRSATPGIGFGPSFVHPYTYGRLAGAHNGWIGAFKTSTARPLLSRLPNQLFAALDGLSDAQTLFLLAVHHHLRAPDAGLAQAVARACGDVAEVCVAHEAGATLNFLIGDGKSFAAARTAVDAPANTLYTLSGGARWPDASVLASEPLDDDEGWTEVPDGCVVSMSANGVDTHEIAELRSAA